MIDDHPGQLNCSCHQSKLVALISPTSHVSSPRLAAFAAVHGSNDEKYKTALDMMCAQRQKTTLLASDRLVDHDHARADLTVATVSFQPKWASFVAVHEEGRKLCEHVT